MKDSEFPAGLGNEGCERSEIFDYRLLAGAYGMVVVKSSRREPASGTDKFPQMQFLRSVMSLACHRLDIRIH